MAGDKILLVRNDKLGDFMLAWPAFSLLKRSAPGLTLHALVPGYTLELAQACPWLDGVVEDPGPEAPLGAQRALLARLRRERYGAVITLFSTFRVGLLCRLAGIPQRLAPATKLAQVFYDQRLVQRRSRSIKPEYQYNLDLARHFLGLRGIAPAGELQRPYLRFDAGEVARLRAGFVAEHGLAAEAQLVFLHPGSGGSANNLSLEQYARLALALRSDGGHVIVISAGPGEEEAGRQLLGQLRRAGCAAVLAVSRQGLLAFCRRLQFADLFISGSTGPLHIAGALDRPTAAFYPASRANSSLRWQTLSAPERRLAFSPPAGAGDDMSRVDLEAAAAQISALLAARVAQA